jgi:hypothetical protein
MTTEQILAILKMLDQLGVDDWLRARARDWMRQQGATDAELAEARSVLARDPEAWLGKRPGAPGPLPPDDFLGVPISAERFEVIRGTLGNNHHVYRLEPDGNQFLVTVANLGPWTIPDGFQPWEGWR